MGFKSSQVSSYGGYLRYRLYTQTMRGDVLSLPAEASRPDILLKVLDPVPAFSPGKRNRENRVSARSNSRPVVLVLQGNQMTLVFMEREYSTPEDPHLGIVHIVEVGRFSQSSSNTVLCGAGGCYGAPPDSSYNMTIATDSPLLLLLTGKFPSRPDR